MKRQMLILCGIFPVLGLATTLEFSSLKSPSAPEIVFSTAVGQAVEAQVFTQGGSQVHLETHLPDSSGMCRIDMSTFSRGPYDVYLKSLLCLRQKVSVSFEPTGVYIGQYAAYVGDTNDDNAVTQADLDYISARSGKNRQSDDWVTGKCYLADMDSDGDVDTADLGLATPNLGRIGD